MQTALQPRSRHKVRRLPRLRFMALVLAIHLSLISASPDRFFTFPPNHSSLARAKAANQTEFVRSEFKNFLDLPYSFRFEKSRSETRVLTEDAGRKIATLILDTYLDYYKKRRQNLQRTIRHIEAGKKLAIQNDEKERIELYYDLINALGLELTKHAGEKIHDRAAWDEIKNSYENLIEGNKNAIFYSAFFSSIKRRFLSADEKDVVLYGTLNGKSARRARRILRRYYREDSTTQLAKQILEDFNRELPFENLERDANDIAAVFNREFHLYENLTSEDIESIDVLKSPLSRFQRVYLVLRIRINSNYVAFIIPLVKKENGFALEWVEEGGKKFPRLITETSAVSELFGYTHSPFQIDSEDHHELIRFIRSILPRKNPVQLYQALGHYNLAKNKLLDDLFHIARTGEKFEFAHSVRGTAFEAFRIPSSGHHIKIMRDEFDFGKETTHAQAKLRYFVMQHADTAGHGVHPFHFMNVRFKKNYFQTDLLEALLAKSKDKVKEDGDYIVIREFYVERDVVPLDRFVREWKDKDPEAVRKVLLDYGRAVRKLAEANIWLGNMSTYNFGVIAIGTPNMRVVAFDWDEIRLLTEMEFDTYQRYIPAGFEDDYMMMDPTKYVIPAPNRVFPEEFEMAIPKEIRPGDNFSREFLDFHPWFIQASGWSEIQDNIRRNHRELIDSFPYSLLLGESNGARSENRFSEFQEGITEASLVIRTHLEKNASARSDLRLLFVPNTLKAENLGIAFGRRDAFEVLTLQILSALAQTGIRIAVVTPTQTERLILEKVNEELPAGKQLFSARSYSDAAHILRASGSEITQSVTTDKSEYALLKPYFDVVFFLPVEEFTQWAKSLGSAFWNGIVNARLNYEQLAISA